MNKQRKCVTLIKMILLLYFAEIFRHLWKKSDLRPVLQENGQKSTVFVLYQNLNYISTHPIASMVGK